MLATAVRNCASMTRLRLDQRSARTPPRRLSMLMGTAKETTARASWKVDSFRE